MKRMTHHVCYQKFEEHLHLWKLLSKMREIPTPPPRHLHKERTSCRWMANNGMADIPLHFSRFFPKYNMRKTLPTPLHILHEARDVALHEGLKNIYLGNV